MFEQVLDLVGEVPTAASTDLSAAELLERIGAVERAIAALQAQQVRDLAAFADARVADDEERRVPLHLTGRTIGTEVGDAVGVSAQSGAGRASRAWVAVAHHPRVLGLLGTGHATMRGLERVLRQTEALSEVDRSVVDALAADDAVRDRLTPARLGRAAARHALIVDPEAATRRAEEARERRGVRLLEPVDGVAVLEAVLRAEDALACHRELEGTARAMRADGDARSVSQLMADLVVERVLGARLAVPGDPAGPADPARWATPDGSPPWPDERPAAAPHDPARDDPVWDVLPVQLPEPSASPVQSRPPPRGQPSYAVEIQVVLGAGTLLGLDDEPALLRGYGPLAASVARALSDNAARRTLRALFADPVDGRLLTMESSARFFTGRLGDLCRWRDQTCRLTDGPIRDVDHREERGRGGATSARNGQSLGRNAHVVKDHPGIRCRPVDAAPVGDGLDRLRRHAPDVEWRLPAGQRRTSVLPAVLGDGARPDPDAWAYDLADRRDDLAAYAVFVDTSAVSGCAA